MMRVESTADAADKVRQDSSPSESIPDAPSQTEGADPESEAGAKDGAEKTAQQKSSARTPHDSNAKKHPPTLPNVASLLDTMRKRLEALNGPDLPRI